MLWLSVPGIALMGALVGTVVGALVGYAAAASASPRASGAAAPREAARPTGRTIQQNLLPSITLPGVRPAGATGASGLADALARELQRNQRPSRRALRRLLRARRPAQQAVALRHLLRHRHLVVPFGDVARVARSRRARLSVRLLAIRAALLPGADPRRARRLLLRLTHGGAVTIREAAYRALNRLPRGSGRLCRRFGELMVRRGLTPRSHRLVAQGFARHCLPYRPRAVLRAARHIRVSVRRGIADGVEGRGPVARRILARLGRDAARRVRLSARFARLRRSAGPPHASRLLLLSRVVRAPSAEPAALLTGPTSDLRSLSIERRATP